MAKAKRRALRKRQGGSGRSRREAASAGAGSDVLARLDKLARNLWWTWEPEAQKVFAALDPVLWDATHHNPIQTLKRLSGPHREAALSNPAFIEEVERCERMLDEYLSGRRWFQKTHGRGGAGRLQVAYFCSEYALHESIPLYAGGLGVLAGDHLKSASDLGVPMVAIGLLYRNGYYEQRLRGDGSTQVIYPDYDYDDLPLVDTGVVVAAPMDSRELRAKVWRLEVGRVPLLLLDADIPENKAADRRITHQLYGGDPDNRIKQQVLLGVGGVRALRALNMKPNVFHLNEGHAAFAGVERLRELTSGGKRRSGAIDKLRASTVFTTHTPVPAGHDRYDPKLCTKLLRPLLDDMKMSDEEFLALGRERPEDNAEPLCMTILALKLASHCNGVSELHGEVSRKMWTGVFETDDPRRVPIGHVTNGVHTRTWLSPEIYPLYERYVKPKWQQPEPLPAWWENVRKIPADELWAARNMLRKRLVHFIRRNLMEQARRRLGSTDDLAHAIEAFREDALTIGFARRFATYKRAPLIFNDPKRLAKILNDPRRPVQIVFAGKAHPRDQQGQAYAQQVFKWTQRPEFRGRVVMLENYDMEIGRMLTSGCDVWLNNPVRPQEASGTSGMKPPLHGGLNLSVLDGWWPEAYNGRNGWSIGDEREQTSAARQDTYDARSIYEVLEREVVPAFYERSRAGIPKRWVKMMHESMRTVGGVFGTNRMVGDYVELYYLPARAGEIPGAAPKTLSD